MEGRWNTSARTVLRYKLPTNSKTRRWYQSTFNTGNTASM